MKQINVTLGEGKDSKRLPLMLNGRTVELIVGEPKDIPEAFMEVLDAAGVSYTVNAGRTAAAAASAPAPVPANDLLSILDGSVADVTASLDGLGRDDLDTLLAAEEAGKTRKGVVAAITKALASLPDNTEGGADA